MVITRQWHVARNRCLCFPWKWSAVPTAVTSWSFTSRRAVSEAQDVKHTLPRQHAPSIPSERAGAAIPQLHLDSHCTHASRGGRGACLLHGLPGMALLGLPAVVTALAGLALCAPGLLHAERGLLWLLVMGVGGEKTSAMGMLLWNCGSSA